MSNKFHAKKTLYNGVWFDSAKEAQRAQDLDLIKRSTEKDPKKKIVEIEYQPKFECVVEGKKICKYFADFMVTYADGHVEYEDVKGLKKGCAYQLFKIKKKLVEALFEVEIIEI